jgi:hypothetical protein
MKVVTGVAVEAVLAVAAVVLTEGRRAAGARATVENAAARFVACYDANGSYLGCKTGPSDVNVATQTKKPLHTDCDRRVRADLFHLAHTPWQAATGVLPERLALPGATLASQQLASAGLTTLDGQFEVMFRFYGLTKALHEKQWQLDDLVLA